MTGYAAIGGALVALATLPGFLLLVRREWERSGGGLFLLSPAFVFYMAYLASFAIRPPLQVMGTLQYDFTETTLETLLIAQSSSLLAWYGFVAGYLLFPADGRPMAMPTAVSRLPPADVRLRTAIAYVLSVVASSGFIASLVGLGVFTLDFGYNRVAYLNAMFGAGHMYLFNIAAATLLLMGLVWSSFCRRRPRLLAVVAWTVWLVPNALVTNRFLISAALFAMLLVLALKRIRSGNRISATSVLLVLLGLAAVGALLGLVRGLSEGLEYAEERSQPIVFFLWTFDMSEFYQITIANLRRFDLGQSWLEDLFLVFLPRAIFTWKPIIYGAVRLQLDIMPGSLPPDGMLSATYPLSMFGEGYANFGFPGVALVGLLVGLALKFVFSRALIAGIDPRRPFWPMLCFCLFVLVCANALGYLRSFGWFASTLVFHTLIFSTCYLMVWTVNELCRGALAGASPSAQRRARVPTVVGGGRPLGA